MPSFDIESLDIASLDIESFDIESFFIESLDIESSFDIESFFMSSEKALGASASLHRLGKTEEAIAHFDAARRIAPDHGLVLTNLAVALADSGQRHDAVVAFRKILKLNPENEYVRHQLRRLSRSLSPSGTPDF
jgi:tetratricopeptide (TPR) repeat protein